MFIKNSVKSMILFIVCFNTIYCQDNLIVLKNKNIVFRKTFDKEIPLNYLALSSLGYYIIKEKAIDKLHLIIKDINSNKSTIIDTFTYDTPLNISIVDDGKAVRYQCKDKYNGRWIENIYFINTNSKTTIKDNTGGDVGGLSVSSKSCKILYKVKRAIDEPPLIYQCDLNGRNAKYIMKGAIPGPWSPDGNWYLVLRSPFNFIHPDVLYEVGKISKEEFEKYEKDNKFTIPELVLFSNNNIETRKLIDIFRPQSQWSSNSNLILIQNNDYASVTIIDIESVKHNNNNKIITLIDDSEYVSDIKWIPSMNNISYIKSYEDGHNILRNELWIYYLNENKSKKLFSDNSFLIRDYIWMNDKLAIEEIDNKQNQLRLLIYNF